MSEDIGVAVVRSPAKKSANIDRFDRTTMVFHWLTVVLLLLQFVTALMLYWLEREYQSLILIHRTTGSFIWLVVAARLAWRHSFAHLPPFPPAMSLIQRRVAMLNEYSLYLLLLLQPLTGLADTLFRGRPFDLLIWHLPALLARNKEIFGIFHKLHELGAMALLLLITVHATAALFHGLVLRDGILARMIPWTDC